MADYYPLIARALEGLSEDTPSARQEIYDRAREALTTQLRAMAPPLPEESFQRERLSLDDAIRRAEEEYGEAAPADGVAVAEGPAASARPPAPTPEIRRGGSRRRRPLLTAAGLAAAVVPIALIAWLWRDRPAAPAVPQATPSSTPATPEVPSGEAKFSERMGGGAAVNGSPRASAQPATSPAPAATAPTPRPPTAAPSNTGTSPPPTSVPTPPAAAPQAVQPDLPVAQRAALIEENAADPQQPKIQSGRVLWRLDAVSGGQGQPLETVVRANVEVPEAGLTLALTIRKNRDTALPASHTLELTFTTDAAARSIADVGLPTLQLDEMSQGTALAGLPVPVKENVFLIGLSDLKSDVDRNTELLMRRNWMKLTLRYGSGQRAALLFEKGVSGDRVMSDAFKLWAQP